MNPVFLNLPITQAKSGFSSLRRAQQFYPQFLKLPDFSILFSFPSRFEKSGFYSTVTDLDQGPITETDIIRLWLEQYRTGPERIGLCLLGTVWNLSRCLHGTVLENEPVLVRNGSITGPAK